MMQRAKAWILRRSPLFRRSPLDEVSAILDRTAADLRRMSADDEDMDARPIIDRAVLELSQLGFNARPGEEAIMERYLEELPDRDYQILRHFKQGKKHSEIAELLGTNLDAVRGSLVKTYTDMRMAMTESGGSDGGGASDVERARKAG